MLRPADTVCLAKDSKQISMISSKRGVGIQRASEIADVMIAEMRSGVLEANHDALMARKATELGYWTTARMTGLRLHGAPMSKRFTNISK